MKTETNSAPDVPALPPSTSLTRSDSSDLSDQSDSVQPSQTKSNQIHPTPSTPGKETVNFLAIFDHQSGRLVTRFRLPASKWHSQISNPQPATFNSQPWSSVSSSTCLPSAKSTILKILCGLITVVISVPTLASDVGIRIRFGLTDKAPQNGMAPVPIGSVRRYQRKAAEDSRTPKRCRACSHAAQSARFWSAAVLCRFASMPAPRRLAYALHSSPSFLCSAAASPRPPTPTPPTPAPAASQSPPTKSNQNSASIFPPCKESPRSILMAMANYPAPNWQLSIQQSSDFSANTFIST